MNQPVAWQQRYGDGEWGPTSEAYYNYWLETKNTTNVGWQCRPLYAHPPHAAPSAESDEGYPGIAHDFEEAKRCLKYARHFFASPQSFSEAEFRAVGREVFGGKCEYTGTLPTYGSPAPPAGAMVSDAMERMEALLDTERGLVSFGEGSATMAGCRADMQTIRAALAGREGERLAQRGERLAKAGERYVAAINVGMAALVVGATPWADDKDEDAVAAADNEISEALRSLNNAAYEFRKAAGGSP